MSGAVRRSTTFAGACLVLCAALAGCARTIVDDPQTTDYAPNDVNAQMDFWHELAGRSAVTNDEAFHGLLLTADGKDETQSYAGRVEVLRERGWLPEGFDEPADMTARRGIVAKIVAHHLGIEGGLMMQITDKLPRYATRELVYLQIMPPGSGQRVLSGAEFLGVIGKMQDYALSEEARRRADAEAYGLDEEQAEGR